MSSTLRHVGTAVGLIISGAHARAEYGPEMTEREYEIAVYKAVIREVDDWMEHATQAERDEVMAEFVPHSEPGNE